MHQVSKIIIISGDTFLFGVKRSPNTPEKDRRMELLGGRLDKGESPLEGLIRELREEETSGLIAEKAAHFRLSPVEIKVEGEPHFLYHMPIEEEVLKNISLDPKEHYGHCFIHRSQITSPKRMKDQTMYTRRTVKIFTKLKRNRYFPYDRA